MNHSIFNTILITGFTVAFFHAAIPTHWLPFVLTSRIQKWSRSKTLLITTLAGLGHVTFTAILGFLVAWCGITLNAKIGAAFPWIAGGALVLFGSYYIYRQFCGKGHGHTHLFGGHDHDHSHHGHEEGKCHHEPKQIPVPKSDWAAIVSLLALLTFSPCEGFLPVYVSGVQYGWSGFFLLTLILSLATVVGMVIFTALTLAGMERLKLEFMEKYESGILGGLLVLLGFMIIFFET